MSTMRAWLQRDPQPTRIRCALPGGDEKTVRIGDSRSRWRDAAASCAGAVRLEAFNDAGESLRVWEEEGGGDDAGAAARGKKGPESSLAELGRIIAEAADASAQRHADAYRLAYEQQALLVNVLSQRLQALERAWHRLLMSETGRTETGEADPNADPSNLLNAQNVQMVATLLAGALAPPLPPPTKSNGSK